MPNAFLIVEKVSNSSRGGLGGQVKCIVPSQRP